MALSLLTLDSPRWASDEDLYSSSPSDYTALVPHSQILASGTDGLFLADSPWTLRSPTVDFADQDVTPGRMAEVKAATSTPSAATAVLTPAGKFAVVDSVAAGVSPAGGLTLRRPGEVALFGQPYAPVGLTGVKFTVATFDRQLAAATARARGALKALAADGLLTSTFDDADLVQLCVYRTFADRYRDRMQITQTTGTGPDPYAGKYQSYLADYKDKLAELTSRLAGPTTVIDPETGLPVPHGLLAGGLIRITTAKPAEWG